MYSKLLYMNFPSKNLHKKDLMGLFPIFLTFGRMRMRPFAILKRVGECDGENTFLFTMEKIFYKNVSYFVFTNFHNSQCDICMKVCNTFISVTYLH